MKLQQQTVTTLVIYLVAICLPPAFWGGTVVNSNNQDDNELSGYIQVGYCELIRHPREYDGKQVVVRATYRYGFEWQEVLCLKCRDEGKTWLEFDGDTTTTLRRSLRQAPRDQGFINAVFYGTFRATKGPYGDGSYSYRFDVRSLKDVKVVYRDGRSPDLLPSNVQKQLCQE